MNLVEILHEPALQKQNERIYGVVVAIVTNNQDPGRLGRVKVQFPWLSDENESAWARVSTPLAGAKRGFYHLPAINDEVLVAFEFGDINYPIILGSLWKGENIPDATEDGKLTIQNTGKVIIESTKGKVIFDDGKLTLQNTGEIVIEATGEVTIKGSKIHLNPP